MQSTSIYLKTRARLTQRETAGYPGTFEAQVSSRLALLEDEEFGKQLERGQLRATAAREEVWKRRQTASGKGRKRKQQEAIGRSPVPLSEEAGQEPVAKAGIDPLATLRQIALRLEGLLKQVEELERADRLAVDQRAVQVVMEGIVERGLRPRRVFLR